MNTNTNVVDSQNISEVKDIRSFLNYCQLIAVLTAILFIILSIISFATAKEVVTHTYASGRTYVEEEVNPVKIGAGIGYIISAPLVGVFNWKLSVVICGFLYDVKKIRNYMKRYIMYVVQNNSSDNGNNEEQESTNTISSNSEKSKFNYLQFPI